MRILVVDDDPGLRQSLGVLLSAEGYEVTAEGSPRSALQLLKSQGFDVVLCDVRMPEMDGLTFLRQYREAGHEGLVIMMSAYGGEDAAIAAMKQGAYDYLPKPFRSDEVVLTLKKAQERERLRGRVATLEAELARWRDGDLVAESPQMKKVMEMVTRVAPHRTTVLITGESGTGKEVLARSIHLASPRRDEEFIAVNCGAIPESLLESELFGHARGSFTGAVADKAGLFEDADKGTLLLDEIGELPPSLQVKLLRVLQESEIRRVGESKVRSIDVRVIAATARDLEQDVAEGQFREDLFYRLNVVRIHVPPLRDRPADLTALVGTLLERAKRRAGRSATISEDAMAAIRSYDWPGNVRELENAIERAAVLSPDGVIRAEHVTRRADAGSSETNGRSTRLADAVAQAERETIKRALESVGGNRNEAAKILGVSVRNLFYKIKQLGI